MAQHWKPARYFLRRAFVADRLDAAHLRHHVVARQLGVSPAYFSQLLNGHRTVSPDVRRAVLDHPAFAGVDEALLWDIKPPRFEQMPLPCLASGAAGVVGVA
jgi:transcriptional regulator with XRE-family HTH domain